MFSMYNEFSEDMEDLINVVLEENRTTPHTKEKIEFKLDFILFYVSDHG